MESLTEAQRNILKFIKDTMNEVGTPPTLREIQKAFGYNAIGTVQDHLKALRRKGVLKETDNRSPRQRARGLIPTDYVANQSKELPVYGEIAAGSTRPSEQIELGRLVISDQFAKDPCFALRVVGNSMIDVGIFEGDYLIVEKEADIKSGDIVAAIVDGETTVKRYVLKDNQVWLFPENSRMKPIAVAGKEWAIQGKVVGLQRKIGA